MRRNTKNATAPMMRIGSRENSENPPPSSSSDAAPEPEPEPDDPPAGATPDSRAWDSPSATPIVPATGSRRSVARCDSNASWTVELGSREPIARLPGESTRMSPR